MNTAMKYLGIDYGTKRIGVAVSDDTGVVAFPLKTVPAGPQALAEVAELVRYNAAQTIIIGESRNFKQEPNPVQEDIEQFKKDLAELLGLPVFYEPEFMTSAQAARALARPKLLERRREGESKDLDASAAALILQSYIDRMKSHDN